jgi:hypothetical protein
VHPNAVDGVEEVLVARLVVFFLVLLQNTDNSPLSCKLVEDLVSFVDLQIAAAVERVDHLFLRALAQEWPPVERAQRIHVDAVAIDGHEVLVLVQEEASDLRLPQLEGFVPELRPLRVR